MLKLYFFCLSTLLIVTVVVRCKPDYLFNYEAGGWLKLHLIPATWEEAFLRCHYEGAVLASPLNKELANAIHTQVKHFGMNSTWSKGIFLGIHDLYSKGHFTSIEGVPLSDMEIKWGSRGADTGDCLTLISDETEYHMSTSSCEVSLPFICYRKLNNLTTNECGTFDNVITPRERSPGRTSLPPGQQVRSRTMLDQDRERFAEIERKRVEAETVTARALSGAVEQMEGLSAAIREGSQTVANALNNIADALRQSRQ